jgi:hypothetical protein
MSRFVLLVLLLGGAKERKAADYLVTSPGATWKYDGPLGPAEVVKVVGKAPDGAVQVAASDQNGGSTMLLWRLNAGAWTEEMSARGKQPVVILPARLVVGASWSWTYTDLMGTTGTHSFHVKSLSDAVVLKNGKKEADCLRVDEFRPDLGPSMPVVHWFARGKGEVASKVGESWYRSLTEFSKKH